MRILEKMPEDFPPQTACTIDLTEGCNLACDYCFTWSNHKARRISEEMGKKIIDWWLPQTDPRVGEAQISWWGGEPLLEWDLLKKLTIHAEKLAESLGKPIGFGGTTNGLLYTPDKVEWTLKHKGLFLVSLDGIEPAHNLHRKNKAGQGSWKKVVKNVRAGLKVAPQLKIRASFGPDTMKYFYDSILFFFEDLGVKDVAFSAVYEGEWTEREWNTMREQFSMAVEYAVKRMKEGKPCVLKHLNDDACLSTQTQNIQNPCGAGGGYIAWSVDGYAFPCHRFNKHGISTEERSNLSTIIARPTKEGFEWCNFEWRKKFYQFKDNPNPKCVGCEIFGKSTCQGGCYALNYDFTGDPTVAPEVECTYNKVQFEVAKFFKELAEKEGMQVQMSGWNGGTMQNNNMNMAQNCVCYNMCYAEGSPDEIKHIDRRTMANCLCYNSQYSGDPIPKFTRFISEIDLEKQKLKQVFGVLKQILLTVDQPKSEEQKKLEKEIIDKIMLLIE